MLDSFWKWLFEVGGLFFERLIMVALCPIVFLTAGCASGIMLILMGIVKAIATSYKWIQELRKEDY